MFKKLMTISMMAAFLVMPASLMPATTTIVINGSSFSVTKNTASGISTITCKPSDYCFLVGKGALRLAAVAAVCSFVNKFGAEVVHSSFCRELGELLYTGACISLKASIIAWLNGKALDFCGY